MVSGEKLELANSMYRFAGSPEAFIVLQVYRGLAGPTDPAGNSIAEDGTFLKEVLSLVIKNDRFILRSHAHQRLDPKRFQD